jgi:hypothetical protein
MVSYGVIFLLEEVNNNVVGEDSKLWSVMGFLKQEWRQLKSHR